MSRSLLRPALALAATLPVAALAAAPANFRDAVGLVLSVIQMVAGLLFAAMTVGLIFAVVWYFYNADDQKSHTVLRTYLKWALIGMFVVFGLWGIVALMYASFWDGVPGIPFVSRPQ